MLSKDSWDTVYGIEIGYTKDSTLGEFPDLADPEHLARRYDGVLNG